MLLLLYEMYFVNLLDTDLMSTTINCESKQKKKKYFYPSVSWVFCCWCCWCYSHLICFPFILKMCIGTHIIYLYMETKHICDTRSIIFWSMNFVGGMFRYSMSGNMQLLLFMLRRNTTQFNIPIVSPTSIDYCFLEV